jgi:hypothetical protein
MYNQSVTRWEKLITFHTIFMKHLVAYQFHLNFLYQGKDVKHFVGYCVRLNFLEQREGYYAICVISSLSTQFSSAGGRNMKRFVAAARQTKMLF